MDGGILKLVILTIEVVLKCAVCYWPSFCNHQASELDLPSRPEDFSPELLTQVLRESGTIPPDSSIESVSMTSLKGGVHFRVCKAVINYKGGLQPHKAPSAVIIKQVNSSSSITTFQKLCLYLKPMFPAWFHFGAAVEELVYRLHGYLIEIQFYRTHAKEVKVPIPQCFYSYYDYYNVKFVMIMQDLSACENGEPSGFTPIQAKAMLINLAGLHAQFWHNNHFRSEKKTWSYGGYWLGDKEMSHEKTIPSVFQATLENFPLVLDRFPEVEKFSQHLTKEIDRITRHVHAREPRTLIHGDYKISNIFIDMVDRPIKPFTIDWQWMGRGSCATDVAYFMYTSLSLTEPSWSFDITHQTKTDPKYPHYSAHEMDLLQTYYQALLSHGIKDYSFKDFEQQYSVNVIYFVIFCLREKWSKMTPTNFEYFSKNAIDGLHLRSMDHMLQLLKRAAVLLEHIDWNTTEKQGYRDFKNKL